ncbi:MAG: type II toxin-antitoxin system RelE/ParE family toxin [Janthinobacterium lividum]
MVLKKQLKDFIFIKKDLDNVARYIMQNPETGQLKKGDLADVRVYKFKMNSLLMLLAYIWQLNLQKVILLKLGSHENF